MNAIITRLHRFCKIKNAIYCFFGLRLFSLYKIRRKPIGDVMPVYVCIALCLCSVPLSGQILGPATAIVGQPTTWTSGMSATTSYTWNVDGVMSNLPLPSVLSARDAGVSLAGIPDYPSVWYDPSNGRWYAFYLSGGITVASFGPANLWRVDLGTDPVSGTPPGGGNLTNLGNFSLHVGASGNADCSHAIVYDSARGEWSCFIMRTGFAIRRIDFGTTLANNPTTSTVVNTPGGGFNMQVSDSKLMYDKGNYVLFVGNRWAQPGRLNFGSDVRNVNPACDMLPNTITHGNSVGSTAGRSSAVEIVQQNGNWYMFTSTTDAGGNNGNKLWRHDFGPNLTSVPARLTGLGTAGYGSHHWALRIIPGLCGREFYGYAQHSQGGVYRINFKGNLLDSIPVVMGDVGTRGNNGWPGLGPRTPWDPSGFHTFVYNDSLYALTSGHSWNKLYITNLMYNFGSSPVHKHPSDNTFTQTFTTPGTYDIMLTVNMDGYGSAQFCRTITVIGTPHPPVYTVAPADVCKVDTIVYEIDSIPGISSWEWMYTGSGVLHSAVTTVPRIELIFTPVATDGTLRVRAVNSFGASAYSDTLIRVRQTPVVSVSPAGPNDVCDGDTLRLTANVNIPVLYQWMHNGNNTGVHTQQYNAGATGDYTVMVTTPDGYCPVTSDPVAVIVHPQPIADLGNDTSICVSALPLRLRSSAPVPPGTHYVWSNGLSTQEMDATRGGIHWLEVSLGNCAHRDSILIHAVSDPDVYIGADTIICEQFPLRIGTEVAGATYAWNTGTTTPYTSVSSTGSYILSVNLEGCVVHDTIEVTAMPYPDIDLGGDRDICPDDTILLDGSYGTSSVYSWNTGEDEAILAATSAGVYGVVVVTEHGCMGGDTVVLSFYPKPTVSLGPDTTVCEESRLMLDPDYTNTDNLLWFDGSSDPQVLIYQAGEYVVTAINKCGATHDTVLVKSIFCDIKVPNIFTPNADGVSDVFRALGNLGSIQEFSLSVYNRWGQQVFRTRDKYQGWDGTFNGTESAMGTYVYLLEFEWGGRKQEKKGSFHLLR